MYYVYRFLDASDQIKYVGKTGNLEKRMTEHFSKQGHLAEEQYRQIEKIEYVELDFQLDMDILEKYLINLWNPPFNTVDKNSNITLFKITDNSLTWKTFDKKKIVKPQNKPVLVTISQKIKKESNLIKYEEIKISNNLINILNQSGLKISEHKLINAMLSKIAPQDMEFKLTKISLWEIQKLCNFSYNNSQRTVKEATINLSNKTLYITEDGIVMPFPLFKTLKYNNNVLLFQFDDNLKPFLLNLKENFIQKELQELQESENEYALRLDMLFTMVINKNNKYKTLEDKINKPTRIRYDISLLKEILGIENKYPQFKEFNRNVLKTAQEEINNLGFYNISIEKENKNKQCVAVIFYVYLGKNIKKY